MKVEFNQNGFKADMGNGEQNPKKPTFPKLPKLPKKGMVCGIISLITALICFAITVFLQIQIHIWELDNISSIYYFVFPLAFFAVCIGVTSMILAIMSLVLCKKDSNDPEKPFGTEEMISIITSILSLVIVFGGVIYVLVGMLI